MVVKHVMHQLLRQVNTLCLSKKRKKKMWKKKLPKNSDKFVFKPFFLEIGGRQADESTGGKQA